MPWICSLDLLRAALALLAAVLLHLPAEAAPATGPALPLRLELIPFTDPLATLLALDKDGRLRCFRFYPSRSVVAGSSERSLPQAERSAIERALAEPALQQALRAKGLAGDGLIQGDQFRLGLAGEGSLPGETWGFVDLAAPPLQGLIDSLLRAAKPPHRLAGARPASAYLRARRVEASRAEDLKRSTPVRIARLPDFSPELQGLILRVVRDPLLFHPLPPVRRAELAGQRSLGEDVFVSVDGLGIFQLRLYSVE